MTTHAAAETPPKSVRSARPKRQLPPKVRFPRVVQSLMIGRSQARFFERCRARYGDAFIFRSLGFGTQMAVTNPELVKAIFTGDREVLRAGESNQTADLLEQVMGKESLILLDGEKHLQHRKLMLPPFHGERMRLYQDSITKIAESNIASWDQERDFALLDETRKITFEVILRVVFGLDSDEKVAAFQEPMTRLLELSDTPEVLFPFLRERLGPIGRWRRFVRYRERVNELVFNEIAERRAVGDVESREDVLSMLMSAKDEDGRGMTDIELRDELLTMLVAGHETTATALAWTFDLLLHHLDKLERLKEELSHGEDKYLKAVIRESLRLKPVIPQCSRMVKQEIRLGPYTVPEGMVLGPNIYLANRNPDVYPQPDSFVPERFLENGPNTYSWIPFGGGIRRCIGASFAEFEMAVVIRTVLERVELEPVRSAIDPSAARTITLSPKHGVRVRAAASL